MKKTIENRYPNSATLFNFCKKALSLRYQGSVKVINQDVGAILGYDPADCSHWKKGKKNIKSLYTLRTLSEHFNIDERLLINITTGNISLEQALLEYTGYGDFYLKPRSLEKLKQDFFKNPTQIQKETSVDSFNHLLNLERPKIVKVVEDILSKGHFIAPPITISDIFRSFPTIHIENNPNTQAWKDTISETRGGELHFRIIFRESINKPYIRFAAIKELYKCLAKNNHKILDNFNTSPEEVLDIQSNLFSGLLLIPEKMLQTELDSVEYSTDITTQLADRFSVSTSFINKRLSDYLTHLN